MKYLIFTDYKIDKKPTNVCGEDINTGTRYRYIDNLKKGKFLNLFWIRLNKFQTKERIN